MKTIKKTFSKLFFLEDRFCYDIEETKKDKFTGEKTFRTSILNGINFTKIVSQEGAITYYLGAEVYGNIRVADRKGVHILFEDGSKLSKPDEEIDVEVHDAETYVYYAFVMITAKELKILSEKLITDTRTHIFDSEIDKESAFIIREHAKCLLK